MTAAKVCQVVLAWNSIVNYLEVIFVIFDALNFLHYVRDVENAFCSMSG